MLAKDFTYEMAYDLYIIKKMSTRALSEHIDLNVTSVKRKLKEYGLTRQMQLETYEFTNLHNDLMIGSVLGDGSFAFQGVNNKFTCRHAENQKDYVQWKLEMLKHVSTYTEVKQSDGNFKASVNSQMMYYFSTKALPYFNKYAEMSIVNAIKSLNNNSLSVWLMDDGYLQKKGNYQGYSLSIQRFSEEELKTLVITLKNKFDLIGKVHIYDTDKYKHGVIYFPVSETPKIKALIESSDFYEDLKRTMSYKLIID